MTLTKEFDVGGGRNFQSIIFLACLGLRSTGMVVGANMGGFAQRITGPPTDGPTDGWTDGLTSRRTNGWTDEWTNGWINGCTDQWVDGWMDKRMDRPSYRDARMHQKKESFPLS